MFVKVLGIIPYFEDSKDGGVEIPDDGKVYFEVISNHFLKGMILRMDKADFNRRFTNERANRDPNMNLRGQSNIYSSREWLFYEKVKWWNANIKGVLDSGSRDEIEFIEVYSNYENEYCEKFKASHLEFLEDKIFFDDLLSEVYVDSNGKVRTKQERIGKPKKRKYCDVCGNTAKYYIQLPNGKIMCKMCEESVAQYNYIQFENQWEDSKS